MVFTYFAVPAEFHKRVLMIGILGALLLRAVMILIGAWLIARFHWVLYVFGAFLVFTGAKMLLVDVYKIPVAWSLAFTFSVLTSTMVLSLRIPSRGRPVGACPFRASRASESRHAGSRWRTRATPSLALSVGPRRPR